MLKKLALVLFILIAGLVAFIATRPTEFRVSRSTVINAPPAAVFEKVNNLRQWNDWSPWAKLDPNAKNTFEGPESGLGAVFGWAGNEKVGEGRMTITDSVPAERILMKLEFFKPFAGTSMTEFTFKPEGQGTAMSWTMTGENNFIAKAMSLVMDCDKMVGGQFEQGFVNLKALVEPSAKELAGTR